MSLWCVVPAAGSGARMGAALPKQYLSLGGRTLIEHTLGRLLSYAPLRAVCVAIAGDDHWFAHLPVASDPRLLCVTGGATRHASVRRALAALAPQARDDDWVLVHDAARPCVRLSDIARLVECVRAGRDGGLLAMPVIDTVKQAAADGRVAATLPREQLWLAATPQMFRYADLCRALDAAEADGVIVTDEAQAMERSGAQPQLVPCARDNIKVTRPEDLRLAAFLLQRQQEEGDA